MVEHLKDGGWKARKLWYCAATSAGVFVSGILAAIWPAFRPCLDMVIGGLLGACGLFLTGNVAGKWAIGKAVKSTQESQSE